MIEFITISSLGNATDFGDLSSSNTDGGDLDLSNQTRGLCGGGMMILNHHRNTIEYVTIASTGNAVDFGDLSY